MSNLKVNKEIEHKFNIYCDEASTESGQYMLIGGIWIPQSALVDVKNKFVAYRDAHGLRREMKWTKVSNKMVSTYQGFVDLFFDTPQLSFKCIVLDKHIIDYNSFHQGDKELGFYKFYYLFISRKLSPHCLYWLYTDERNNRRANRLTTLKDVVNNWSIREYGAQPLQHIEPCRSHNEDFIQLADIIMGALAYRWNGLDTSEPKLALAKHIADRLGWNDLNHCTSRTENKFNVWHWKPA